MRHNDPISSDDPNALQALEQKLERLERLQAAMKQANAAIRGNKGQRTLQIAALLKVEGITESLAEKLLVPDYAGRTGYPSFELSNNNAEIRRVRTRIAELRAARDDVDREWQAGEVRVHDDVAGNRLRLFFPGKPDREMRTRLKRHGFKWAPSVGAWQRMRGGLALASAGYVLEVSFASLAPIEPAAPAPSGAPAGGVEAPATAHQADERDACRSRAA